MRKRKFWGWGYEDEILSAEEEKSIDSRIAKTFQLDDFETLPIPKAKEIDLPKPNVVAPSTLAKIMSDDKEERLNHTYGKSFPDAARSLLQDFSSPPDLVAFPDTEDELISVMDWCDENNVAVIPYGGGSSVCGGVETQVGDSYEAVISLDV